MHTGRLIHQMKSLMGDFTVTEGHSETVFQLSNTPIIKDLVCENKSNVIIV